MAINVTCGCGKSYRVDDAMAGKKGKCKACGSVLATPPARRPAATQSAARRPEPVAAPVAAAAPSNPLDALSEAAYMEQNAAVEPDAPVAVAPPLPAMPAMPRQAPVAAAPAYGSGGGYAGRPYAGSRKSEPANTGSSPWKAVSLAVAGLVAVLFAVMFLLPSAASAAMLGLVLIGAALALLGAVRLLITAFRESAVCGLMYLFVPFYALYYLVTRWQDTKVPFATYLAGIVILFGGAFSGANLSEAGQRVVMVKSAANLRSCGQAIMLYANSHQGAAPANLETLVGDAGLASESVVTPGTQTPYTYLLQAGIDTRQLSSFHPVAYDEHFMRKGDKTVVLFGDGHAETMPATMARSMAEEFRHNVLPKLPRVRKP